MQYRVISTHPDEAHDEYADRFDTLAEAEGFCRDLSKEGWTCTVYQPLRTFEAQEYTPEDENAGIWAPMTLHPPVRVVRVA